MPVSSPSRMQGVPGAARPERPLTGRRVRTRCLCPAGTQSGGRKRVVHQGIKLATLSRTCQANSLAFCRSSALGCSLTSAMYVSHSSSSVKIVL